MMRGRVGKEEGGRGRRGWKSATRAKLAMREQSGQKAKRGEGGSVEKRRNKPLSGEEIRKPIRMKIKQEGP
jgi:hypothetical protein